MASMVVIPLERRLGFRSKPGRGLARWPRNSPKVIRDFLAEMGAVVEASKTLPREDILRSAEIKDQSNQIFQKYGAVLWPGPEELAPGWMMDEYSEDWPARMYFERAEDRERLEKYLQQLVVAKCCYKSQNHEQKMTKRIMEAEEGIEAPKPRRYVRKSMPLPLDDAEEIALPMEFADDENLYIEGLRHPQRKRKRWRFQEDVPEDATVSTFAEEVEDAPQSRVVRLSTVGQTPRDPAEGDERLPSPRKTPVPVEEDGFFDGGTLNPKRGQSRIDTLSTESGERDDPVFLGHSSSARTESPAGPLQVSSRTPRKPDVILISVNWNQALDFLDYTRVEHCESADGLFGLLQGLLPDEIRDKGLTMREIRVIELGSPAPWPRIVRDAPGADDAVRVLVERVQDLLDQPGIVRSGLELSVLWKAVPVS